MPRETHEIASPASSITKLGFVRFCLPPDPALVRDARRIRIVELPSFSIEEGEPPRVQMQPLPARRRAWTANGSEADPAPDAASGSQRARTSTLVGVEPFAARPRGSSPSIAIAACEAAAPAPAAAEPAPEREPDPLVLLQRLRQLQPPLASQADRAALRRLRRLTRPRVSGSSMFDALADGAEIVVGMRPARARWRVAIIGAAVAAAGAAAGLAALL